MAGRHRRPTWWRRLQGDSGRDRSGSRLAGVIDAGTLVEHLVSGEAAADRWGHYVAVCGARVLPTSLTVPERGFCPRCAGAP